MYEASAQQAGHFTAPFPYRSPVHGGSPCTYRDWLRVRLDRDIVGDFTPVRVQVLRKGVKACAVVAEAELGDGSQDWFRVVVEGESRPSWLPSTKVRMCSGDGRCRCEKDADEAAGFGRACATVPADSDVPPGNTGTTVGDEA